MFVLVFAVAVFCGSLCCFWGRTRQTPSAKLLFLHCYCFVPNLQRTSTTVTVWTTTLRQVVFGSFTADVIIPGL